MSSPTWQQQYLAFALAGGDYAIGIRQAKEILQYEEVTRIPSAPPSIRGVINLRGSVVPVVDLAAKFGLPETSVTKRTCVLVVEATIDEVSTVMGLVADTVSEVIELGPGDIEKMPPFGARVKVDYIAGMGKMGRKFVLILDLDRILTAEEHDLAAALESATALPESVVDQAVHGGAGEEGVAKHRRPLVDGAVGGD